MEYLIEGEVIDTYGGDYLYRDIYYDIEDGKYVITELTYGFKRGEKINESEEIGLFDNKVDFDLFISKLDC